MIDRLSCEIVFSGYEQIDFCVSAFRFIQQFANTSDRFLRLMYPEHTNDSSKMFAFNPNAIKVTHLVSTANSLIQDLHADMVPDRAKKPTTQASRFDVPIKKDWFNWWKFQENSWYKYKAHHEQFGLVSLSCLYFPEGKTFQIIYF